MLFIIIGLLSVFSVFAQKTDWVFLKKDNQILCEIKQLEFGKLRVKGYEMGTVRIEWDAVDSLWSDKDFMIKLEDGTIIESRLDESWYANYNHPWEEIIEITLLEDQFLNRIEGEVDIGFNYNKSSNIFQLNVSSDLSYHNFKNSTTLFINNLTTLDRDDDEKDRTKKKDIDLVDDYFLPNNYLIRGIVGFEQNTELGINGRLYSAVGLGKELLHSQQSWLLFGLGARANREWSTDEINKGYSAEGVFLIEFKRFSFDFPEIDIETNLTFLPSLSDWGRIRTDMDVKAKIELIDDFFFSLKFYYSLDNNPIDETAEKSDWGLTTSVGYKF
jgi:hypothetical protein